MTLKLEADGIIDPCYFSDLSLEPAVRDEMGRVTRATFMAGDTEIYDEVNLSSSGLVVSGEENGAAKSYSYDKAGRLTAATIGDDEFAYEFGAQGESCNGLSNINTNAAKNSNRTKLIKNDEVTTYCYNTADQLVASSDGRFDQAVYDSRGNTTSLGAGDVVTTFDYDVSDRNTKITETNAGKVTEVEYLRDVASRVMTRTSKENSMVKSDERYVYTGGGSGHSAITDTNGNLQKVYLSLPGAVNVTISPTKQDDDAEKTVYSLSNMHSDTMATVGADGEVIGVFITGPFGEVLEAEKPENSTDDTSFGYVGKHAKVTESSLEIGVIQMGARVYIPELGRFLQIDQVDGGTLNMYVYAMDPVNQSDLSGMAVTAQELVNFGNRTAEAMPGWLKYIGYAIAGVGYVAIAANVISKRIADTATGTQKQEKQRCKTYTQAPGYPGRKSVSPSDRFVVKKHRL